MRLSSQQRIKPRPLAVAIMVVICCGGINSCKTVGKLDWLNTTASYKAKTANIKRFLQLHRDLALRENSKTIQDVLEGYASGRLSLRDVEFSIRIDGSVRAPGESGLGRSGHTDLRSEVVSALYSCVGNPRNQWTDIETNRIRSLALEAIHRDGLTSWIVRSAESNPAFADFRQLRASEAKDKRMSAYLHLLLIQNESKATVNRGSQ